MQQKENPNLYIWILFWRLIDLLGKILRKTLACQVDLQTPGLTLPIKENVSSSPECKQLWENLLSEKKRLKSSRVLSDEERWAFKDDARKCAQTASAQLGEQIRRKLGGYWGGMPHRQTGWSQRAKLPELLRQSSIAGECRGCQGIQQGRRTWQGPNPRALHWHGTLRQNHGHGYSGTCLFPILYDLQREKNTKVAKHWR